MIRKLQVLLATLLALGMVGISSAHPTFAATVNDCPATETALQTDINNAGAGGTVTFNCTSPTTVPFTSSITINSSVTLDASSSAAVTLDGQNSTPFFSVNSGVSLTLSHLTLQNGCACGTSGYSASYGGAIYNAGGTVTITSSTLSGNYSAGGAIYNDGMVTITNSTLAHNNGPWGGAIYNDLRGTVTITNSTLSGNSAFYGGAIYNMGTVTITNSTLYGNSAHEGGAIFNLGPATITNSTLANNSAVSYGGAISNHANVTITNSTLANNSATERGGGAIVNVGNVVTITNSTLSGNSAPYGGAIDNYYYSTVKVGGSIIANSTSGGNCYKNSATITDLGYNLEDDTAATCDFSAANHDIVGQNPDLGSLANNGGPTQTIALQSGSPAIDHIPTSNATLCPTSSTDQRGAGYPRPDNSETACDIGAYEYQDAGGVTQQSQTITFGTLADKTYGAAPFTVSATASSGLAVSFGSTTLGVCTVSGSTVSIVSAGTCTIDADQAGNNNYSAAAQVPQSFTVARASLSVAANDQSMTYGGAVPTFDATSTGLAYSDTFAGLSGSCSATVNGSAVSSSTSAGSYPDAITCSGVDTTNYTVTYTAGTLTVNKAPLTVTADNQGPVQYSDPMPSLTAVISEFVNGQTLATSGVTGSPSCSTPAGTTTVTAGQGSYAIICTAGTLTAANYSFTNLVTGTLSVTQETAAIQYTGGSAVMLPSSGSASITLSATVWDSAAKGYPNWGATDPDGLTTDTPGDVTKMFVQWEIWPSGSCLSGTPSTIVGPVAVATTTPGIGTASSTWPQSSDGSYCVVAQVVGSTAGSPNQYYIANDAQVAGIAFYTNTGQFATGGGWIADSTSSTGQGSLSFNARYTKQGGAKGQMAYSWQGMYNGQLANFTITSNAISTLTFSGTTAPVTATLQGKCAESIVSVASGQLLSSQGNLTFTATAKDGDYGLSQNIPSDAFSLSVFDSSNTVIKQVTSMPLAGGNLVVHNG